MQAVMNVIVPLRGVVSRRATRITLQWRRLVLLVFKKQMNLAIGYRLTDPRRNLVKDVTCAVILDGVDGI